MPSPLGSGFRIEAQRRGPSRFCGVQLQPWWLPFKFMNTLFFLLGAISQAIYSLGDENSLAWLTSAQLCLLLVAFPDPQIGHDPHHLLSKHRKPLSFTGLNARLVAPSSAHLYGPLTDCDATRTKRTWSYIPTGATPAPSRVPGTHLAKEVFGARTLKEARPFSRRKLEGPAQVATLLSHWKCTWPTALLSCPTTVICIQESLGHRQLGWVQIESQKCPFSHPSFATQGMRLWRSHWLIASPPHRVPSDTKTVCLTTCDGKRCSHFALWPKNF